MRTSSAILVAATVAFAVAPALSPSFTGYEPGQFPVTIVRPSIQPAGYAFSIWGVIYAWLIAHAGFGMLRRAEDPAWAAVRLPLTGALVLGTVWLAIAGVAPITATVVIVAMAALALVAFLKADPNRDRWILSAPLAILAGWLTAASAVSLGVVLGGYGWLGDTVSALTMLTLVLVIAVWVQSRNRQMPLFGATIVWALGGIVAANWGDVAVVAYAALIGAVIMALATILLVQRNRTSD